MELAISIIIKSNFCFYFLFVSMFVSNYNTSSYRSMLIDQ